MEGAGAHAADDKRQEEMAARNKGSAPIERFMRLSSREQMDGNLNSGENRRNSKYLFVRLASDPNPFAQQDLKGLFMHRRFAEVKLAAWHRLFRELEQARSQLESALARASPDLDRIGRLEAEIDQLERECDWALVEIAHAALGLAKHEKGAIRSLTAAPP